MPLLPAAVLLVLEFVVKDPAVICNFATIARLNGILIKPVMLREQRDKVLRERPAAVLVKTPKIVSELRKYFESRFYLIAFLGDDIKPCPRCQVLIVKMDDGSCNHMVCAVCGSEFCWLCMKEISDLHYLSPSGCTFWGTKPWSRKKKLLWQLGTLVGAPVGIALVAGIAVPAMIIGKLFLFFQFYFCKILSLSFVLFKIDLKSFLFTFLLFARRKYIRNCDLI